jgi:hypothetical protein
MKNSEMSNTEYRILNIDSSSFNIPREYRVFKPGTLEVFDIRYFKYRHQKVVVGLAFYV